MQSQRDPVEDVLVDCGGSFEVEEVAGVLDDLHARAGREVVGDVGYERDVDAPVAVAVEVERGLGGTAGSLPSAPDAPAR